MLPTPRAVGSSALSNNGTGVQNTVLGSSAGSINTSGSRNILIGYNVQATAATTSDYLNIGGIIMGDTRTAAAINANGLEIKGSGALRVPNGNNTTDRPGAPLNGMIRYNTTTSVCYFFHRRLYV